MSVLKNGHPETPATEITLNVAAGGFFEGFAPDPLASATNSG